MLFWSIPLVQPFSLMYFFPPAIVKISLSAFWYSYLQEKGHEVKIFTSSKIHNTSVNMITNKKLYIEKVVDGIP